MFPNVRCRFIDDEDKDVEEGQPGELLISGPFVCKGNTVLSLDVQRWAHLPCIGYRNNPEANRTSFLDGFYRTGDIGIWKNGLIYIVDRKKELIKYKGLQVAPAELEALLLTHPKVNDAAVIGVPDVVGGEVPRAFVVKTPGVDQDRLAQEIVEFVKENLADHKRLRGWVKFIDEIPKSASGKILRKDLQRKYAQWRTSKI